MQVLVKQKDRDDQIVRLASAMAYVFAFIEDTEPLKTITAHMKTVTLLIQQVTECGYFIAEYAKQKNFCSSPLPSQHLPLISVSRDSDGKIHDL